MNKVKPLSANDAPREMNHLAVEFHLKSVAGRILTLVDGMLPEGKQNTALKTLIKKEFREEFGRVFRYFMDGCGESTGLPEVKKFEEFAEI